VFRARDTITDDTVALKELNPKVKAPQRELLLARKISHPNVCRTHDLYIEDGRTLISMEFVDGETLRSLMERSGPLPVDQCLQIVRQILNGLEAAHRKGIIHRDLKPGNIMIARDGTVKIMDFGHSRIVDQSPDPYLTNSNIEGSRGYVAPEQAMGLVTDERTDLFSVGVILYEMVSGKRMGRVAPAQIPGVPPFVEAAILQCLAMEPSRRFASISMLREALAGPRRYRPAALYASILLPGLVIAVGIWQMQRPPVAPAAPPVSTVVTELPAVAVVFDGQVGNAFANALVQTKKVRVVDRTEVERLLSELRREKKQMDDASAQRIGRVVGAKYFLVVNAQVSQGQIRINARLIETETTEVKVAEGVGGDVADGEKLAVQLAGLVAEKAGSLK